MAIDKPPRIRRQSLGSSQPSLQKLLLPTEFHPNGRVQIDPTTGTIKGTRNNVLYKTRKRINGREVEMAVNGGHAKSDGSVWRVALLGPSRYFWKLMRDELGFRLRGTRVVSAPTLTDEEMLEARQFVTFLLTTQKDGKSALPDDFLNKKYDLGMRAVFSGIDGQFYAWLKKQEKAPELARLTDVYQFLPA